MVNVDTVNEQDFASLLVRIDQQNEPTFRTNQVFSQFNLHGILIIGITVPYYPKKCQYRDLKYLLG